MKILHTPIRLVLFALVASGPFASAQDAEREAARREAVAVRPNVVLIVADDLGWRDLSCQGSKFYATPNIDRLAAEGMRLTHGYANAPNCAPTRACLMTGLYTPRHGVYTVGRSARGRSTHRKLVPTENETVLGDDFVTIPEVLKKRGYLSAFFGKWHLGEDARTQGFDVNVGGCKFGHPKSYTSPYKNPKLEDGPVGEYLTDRLTTEALAFMRKNSKRPFFCQLSYYAVHTPIQPKAGSAKPFRNKEPDRGQKNARYAGMVATLDENVGRVLDLLDELELSAKTLVVFVSDNGGHGGITSNLPLRGAKGMLYEGGIRVPWIVRQPGMIEAGGVSEVPVITSDLLATFAALAGVDKADVPETDGVDLLPLFYRRTALPRRSLYWHFPAYLQLSAKQGTWRTTPASAIRQGKYKLLHFFEDNRHELYDLEKDPGERNDLSAKEPGLVVDLEAVLAKWRLETGAPIPSERNPDYGK